MNFKKNSAKPQSAEEGSDIKPVSDDSLESVSGAGNPWENIISVPLQPINEEIWQRNQGAMDNNLNAR